MATVDHAGIMLCMECGCCSFVCPAHIPIVQNNKLAKSALREEKARLEREAKEKAEKKEKEEKAKEEKGND